MTILYTEPIPPTPTACPCMACHEYGPYCADACAKFDAWEKAGKPGLKAATVKEASS